MYHASLSRFTLTANSICRPSLMPLPASSRLSQGPLSTGKPGPPCHPEPPTARRQAPVSRYLHAVAVFGAPRPGDWEFARLLESRLPGGCLRCLHGADMVCSLPNDPEYAAPGVLLFIRSAAPGLSPAARWAHAWQPGAGTDCTPHPDHAPPCGVRLVLNVWEGRAVAEQAAWQPQGRQGMI